MVPHGAILPSAGVSCYVSYLLYNGLSYDNNTTCNLSVFRDHTSIQVIIGLIIICISVGYFCVANSPRLIDSDTNPHNNDSELMANDDDNGNMKNSKKKNTSKAINMSSKQDNDTNNKNKNKSKGSNKKDKSNYEEEDDDDENNELKTGNYEDLDDPDYVDDDGDGNGGINVENSNEIQSVNIVFHLLMCLGCYYVLMVFTAWQTEAHTNGNQSETILWINVAIQWGVIVLYIVTLIAPSICPDRFNHDDE